jgi:hypothetical protein
LRVEQRVVTMATLAGALESVRRVVVPPGAVVTPAVREAIKKRGLELCYGARASGPAAASDKRSLLVGIGAVKSPPTALQKAIIEEYRGAEFCEKDCLIQVTRTVTQAVAAGHRLGVIVTQRPAVAVCLANRQAAVRGVWGASVSVVAAAAQTAGANLLIVSPTEHSLHELRSMLREFVHGNHVCPETWKTALA